MWTAKWWLNDQPPLSKKDIGLPGWQIHDDPGRAGNVPERVA
jgi:hypothetical protein